MTGRPSRGTPAYAWGGLDGGPVAIDYGNIE
jgi:hypothetical protein